MRKSIVIGLSFLFFSCSNKEIQLPKAEGTIVANVLDNSTVYLFFETKGKDTFVAVNRKNSISSTNWLFAIDKRLPLRLVIPEVIKLQAKKNRSEHKNEKAENYFSYMDNVKKSLAFLPFTKVAYQMQQPKFGVLILFDNSNAITVNGVSVPKENLQKHLNSLLSDKPNKYQFCFDKNLSFGDYIVDKVMINDLKFPFPILNLSNQEFIY